MHHIVLSHSCRWTGGYFACVVVLLLVLAVLCVPPKLCANGLCFSFVILLYFFLGLCSTLPSPLCGVHSILIHASAFNLSWRRYGGMFMAVSAKMPGLRAPSVVAAIWLVGGCRDCVPVCLCAVSDVSAVTVFAVTAVRVRRCCYLAGGCNLCSQRSEVFGS